MRHRFGRGAALGLALLLALTGCGSVSFEPEASTLYVTKEGTVTGAEIESFDNSSFTEARYDETELTEFVEEAVISYNKEACGQEYAYADDTEETLSVSVEKLEVADAVATLYLNYATCEDYLAFNETDETVTELSVQTAADAVAAGVSLDGLVDADGAAVDTSKMQESTKYYVVTIAGETDLMVDGKIAAVSEGVTVTDKHTVTVSGGETVYIVFK
ncbi:MAG: hypothetical protein LUE23_06955 [Lachnospiraceae bacterium]|nr:hypothetical protein [Lachnospiraceae bacterium]